MKKCPVCNTEKEFSEFYKSSSQASGYRQICKKCDNKERGVRRKNKMKTDSGYRKKWTRKVFLTKKRKELKDPIFKLKRNLQSKLSQSIKHGYNDKTKAHRLLGLKWGVLREYIESKFYEGMSWENFGQWQIDHIFPLSQAKSEEELYKLFHYTNIQPLWAKDNLEKSDKLPESVEP